MSKFVEEILKSIKSDPTSWKDFNGSGLSKDNICIKYYGNSRLLSIISVYINDKSIPCSYKDKWKLESIISWWYKTQSLKTISD